MSTAVGTPRCTRVVCAAALLCGVLLIGSPNFVSAEDEGQIGGISRPTAPVSKHTAPSRKKTDVKNASVPVQLAWSRSDAKLKPMARAEPVILPCPRPISPTPSKFANAAPDQRNVRGPNDGDQCVVLTSASGVVEMMRVSDGSTVWRVEVGSAVHGTPCAMPISSSGGGNDATQSTMNAVFAAEGMVDPARSLKPALSPLDVVVATTKGTVLRLSHRTGQTVWTYTAPMAAWLFAPTCGSDGRVYVGSRASTLIVIDASDGKALAVGVVTAGIWARPLIDVARQIAIVPVTATCTVVAMSLCGIPSAKSSAFKPSNSNSSESIAKSPPASGASVKTSALSSSNCADKTRMPKEKASGEAAPWSPVELRQMWTFDALPGVFGEKPRRRCWIFTPPIALPSLAAFKSRRAQGPSSSSSASPSKPAIDAVAVGTKLGVIFGLDPSTGKTLWQKTAAGGHGLVDRFHFMRSAMPVPKRSVRSGKSTDSINESITDEFVGTRLCAATETGSTVACLAPTTGDDDGGDASIPSWRSAKVSVAWKSQDFGNVAAGPGVIQVAATSLPSVSPSSSDQRQTQTDLVPAERFTVRSVLVTSSTSQLSRASDAAPLLTLVDPMTGKRIPVGPMVPTSTADRFGEGTGTANGEKTGNGEKKIDDASPSSSTSAVPGSIPHCRSPIAIATTSPAQSVLGDGFVGSPRYYFPSTGPKSSKESFGGGAATVVVVCKSGSVSAFRIATGLPSADDKEKSGASTSAPTATSDGTQPSAPTRPTRRPKFETNYGKPDLFDPSRSPWALLIFGSISFGVIVTVAWYSTSSRRQSIPTSPRPASNGPNAGPKQKPNSDASASVVLQRTPSSNTATMAQQAASAPGIAAANTGGLAGSGVGVASSSAIVARVSQRTPVRSSGSGTGRKGEGSGRLRTVSNSSFTGRPESETEPLV